VNPYSDAGLIGVNRKLAAMGTNEHINFQMAQGPAAVSGPVNWHVVACSRSNGADPTGLRYLG
jgi:hypothetical protein